jgi:hypothetical protein
MNVMAFNIGHTAHDELGHSRVRHCYHPCPTDDRFKFLKRAEEGELLAQGLTSATLAGTI